MDKNKAALYPPMGWNSWDCYGAAVTEKQLLQNADFMAEHLKAYGWEYIVCDIQWYEPTADSTHYHKFADLCMDEYGRLLPAVNRFPSAEGNNGFKPIADYIHAKGLKFGIHIMRGIPRQAVAQNVPIKGTNYTARDIAHPWSQCCWNTDMYGIDPNKPGAQQYYNSIIELYASWGVDFLKVDDICVQYLRPGDEEGISYGSAEVEMLRHAIDRSNRNIVLSLSPGPAISANAEHLRKNANMWRITNDLWDSWDNIMEMFERCNTWSPYVSEGCYPDCDMLPLGHLSIKGCEHGLSERWTRLSKDEQQTMISLWCMFRSPLILGCELTDLDEWTKTLITNPDVLNLTKYSFGAHQVLRTPDLIVWMSHGMNGETYIALFNIAGWTDTFSVNLTSLDLAGAYHVTDMWNDDESIISENYITQIHAHGVKLICLTPSSK